MDEMSCDQLLPFSSNFGTSLSNSGGFAIVLNFFKKIVDYFNIPSAYELLFQKFFFLLNMTSKDN